jgi:ferric-dicitrate binding protein FerR (iron transport regulator)
VSGRADSSRDGVAELVHGAGPRPAVPAAAAGRSRAVVHAAWRGEIRRRRARRRALAAAIALPVLLTTALALREHAPRPPGDVIGTVARLTGETATAAGGILSPGAPVRIGDEIVTLANARLALALAGGRSLRLDGGTTARLGAGGAVDLSRGALYVDSPAGSHGRARVRTPLGEAIEHGTQFEVRLAQGGVALRVRVGEVEWVGRGGRRGVAAGSGLFVAPSGVLRALTVDRAGEAWAWTWSAAPPFELEGATLAEFLAWFERETGRAVRLAPATAEAARRVRLHGALPALAPEAAIEMVARSSGLVARRSGDEWIVEEGG